MTDSRIPELDNLYSEIRSYRSTKEFKNMLDFITKFKELGPYNAALVYRQRPGSIYVATPSCWRNRFSRYIKPGACPLVMLRPFGPIEFVFELADTEGKPVTEEILHPFRPEGVVSGIQYDNLVNSLKGIGVGVFESEQGSSSAGFCKVDPNHKKLKTEILYDIVVNKNATKEEKFATILHEAGHILCGHLGTPNTKLWADRSGQNENLMEFEAEVVCWLVCGKFGIKNPSPRYLIDQLDPKGEIPKYSEDTVLKVTGSVESMIMSVKAPRKEFVVSRE
jgi:hypothetical protein